MATVQLSRQDFDRVTGTGIVLVDWWATWCAPCRAFAPIFEAAAARHPDVVFAKVDTDAEPELAASFAISSIPSLFIFRDGLLLFAQPGMLPGAALDELVTKVRALDMDDARRRLAEAEAAGARKGA